MLTNRLSWGKVLRSPLTGFVVGVPTGTLLAIALTGQSVQDSVAGAIVGGIAGYATVALTRKSRPAKQ